MQHKLPLIAVNGVIGAQLSPLDRGFNYGDGVFETCRLMNAQVPLWDFHVERLINSCKNLAIPIDKKLIESHVANLLLALSPADSVNAVVKIIITRGEGGRGYSIPQIVTPTIVAGVFSLTQYPDSYFSEGVNIRLCQQRLGCNTNLAGIKHLNRLEQVLARAEWQDDTIAEGILLDVNDYLVEAVFSNVFLVKNGELFTPDLSEAGVAGVMRRFIIENILPKAALNIHIKKCVLHDLTNADEVFLCNSNYGIWPVKTFTDTKTYKFPVGVITNQLQGYLKLLLSQQSPSLSN